MSRTISKEELTKILEDHKLWLNSEGKEGTRANLSDVFLWGADLRGANLSGADLSGADLRRVNLRDAYLIKTNLRGANLSEANLTRADLYGIIGKVILTFQAGQHFAYACDGYIRIGCLTMAVEEWLKDYKRIGKYHNYSKEEIMMYGDFIKSANKRMKA